MPPHQTNLTAETGHAASGLRVDLSIALVKDTMSEALAAPSDASIAALRDTLSEKDAAGPPAAPTWTIVRVIGRCWRAFQERRRRESLRASLYDLSERELLDIGITHAEIDYIVAQRALDRLRDSTPYLEVLSRGVG
jgi:uncharacterized protein YjiS (DUF1127 family)